jgi:hypothetical protein
VRRAATLVALVTLIVTLTAGCSRRSSNVVPPKPGVPTSRARIAGIYRTVHGSILQLRDDGDFFVLAGARPVSGRFDVDAGAFTVSGGPCGERAGRYQVRVTGKPRPNEARLEFTLVDDHCTARRQPLVDERWVYVES